MFCILLVAIHIICMTSSFLAVLWPVLLKGCDQRVTRSLKNDEGGTLCLVFQQNSNSSWGKSLESILTTCIRKSSRTPAQLSQRVCSLAWCSRTGTVMGRSRIRGDIKILEGVAVVGASCLDMSVRWEIGAASRPWPPVKTGLWVSLLWELGNKGQIGHRIPGKKHR